MSISTANGFVTSGSTFADLIVDSASDTTWYKIWDQQNSEYITDGALAVNDGWVSAASLAQMTVDLSAGENKYYIKSYGSTSGQSAWADMTVSLGTTDSYATFADTAREAFAPIFYDELIDTSKIADNAWIRIWNATTDSYLGDGWVRASDLANYSYTPLEEGTETQIWVDTYLYGSGRSGWENFTITHLEHTSSDSDDDVPEDGSIDYGSGDDQITGSTGDDLIYAGSGDDIIDGGDGDDTIYGESGDDHLQGGEGTNLLFGGSGFDTAVYEGDKNDYTFAWSENELLQISTATIQDTLDNIEQLQIGDHTYQMDDVIALNDSAGGTENSLAIPSADLLTNDFSLKYHADFSFVADENGVVGTTTEGVDIILDSGILDFAPGETGYDYLDQEDAHATEFTYTLENGNGLTDTATVTLTLIGENDAAVFSGDLSDQIYYLSGMETLSASGDADNTDVDQSDGNDEFQVVETGTAEYGTYAVDDSGNWTYTFGTPSGSELTTLSAGETLQDTLTLTSADGSTFDVEVSISSVIDFEDVIVGSNGEVEIADGYKGFNWNVPESGEELSNNLFVVDGDLASYGQNSGYFVAGSNVAFTPNASEPVTITRDDATDFTFKSVEMTSAWNTTEDIWIEGYNGGVSVGSQEVQITNTQPTTITAEWGLIDTLSINILGSSAPEEYNGAYDHVIFDNFCLI